MCPIYSNCLLKASADSASMPVRKVCKLQVVRSSERVSYSLWYMLGLYGNKFTGNSGRIRIPRRPGSRWSNALRATVDVDLQSR
jgi:hypothetical protein